MRPISFHDAKSACAQPSLCASACFTTYIVPQPPQLRLISAAMIGYLTLAAGVPCRMRRILRGRRLRAAERLAAVAVEHALLRCLRLDEADARRQSLRYAEVPGHPKLRCPLCQEALAQSPSGIGQGRALSCRLSGSATVGRLHPCQLNQYGERVGDGGSVAAAPRWIGGVVSAWRKLMYGPDDLRKQVDPTDRSLSERTSNAAEQRLAVVLCSTL